LGLPGVRVVEFPEIGTWGAGFLAANTVALWGWLILLFAPRTPGWIVFPKLVFPLAVSAAYVVAVALTVPTLDPAASYMTLDGIKALAANDGFLVAGWMHVVAFDLFIGAWAAERMGAAGWGRLPQAPVLIAIFMAGPFGFLIAFALTARLGSGLKHPGS
jgi:hypothetical protein